MKPAKKSWGLWTVFIIPIGILIFWELSVSTGKISSTILPPPSRIINSGLRSVQSGSLARNIFASLKRVGTGYICGSIAGILLGISMGLSPLCRRLFSFLTGFLRPIPIIAWVPVMILLVGIGEESKIIIISIGTFWPVLVNVMDSISNVDEKYIEVAKIFVKSTPEIITRVILPAAMPGIFTGLRLGIGTAWLSVISAELIAASSGLGYLISYAREMAQPANMFVGVFTIGLIGCLLNIILNHIEKHFLKWN